MSFFPTSGPQGSTGYSEYVRVHRATDTTVQGGFYTYLCLLGAGSPATTASEVCFSR